jgi:hypothetical protein
MSVCLSCLSNMKLFSDNSCCNKKTYQEYTGTNAATTVLVFI